MMSNISYIKKLFLIVIITLFFISCENTGDKQTLKQIAITLISNYADGEGLAPTIRNYEDAGIIGVNGQNLLKLNLFIQTLVAEDIDTEEELNAVIDALGVSLASDIFGPIITIHGENPLTLVQGSTYTDPVVTAIDGRDGEVTVYCAGEVDTNRVGTYIVTHSAVDDAGNLVTVQRVIHIVTAPTPPTTPSATLFSLSGNASGIVGTAVLQNNNGDNLSVSNGTFIFNTSLTDTTNYGVTVLTPPAGQTCTLTNAIGTISGANIIDIQLTCTTIPTPPASLFSIGGNASGIVGTAVLQNNNGDNLSVSNGTFIFNTSLTDTTNYGVTVLTPPAGQTCTLTNAIGTISGANIIDIQLTCVTLPPTGFKINFILNEDDPFLGGNTISITMGNTINNDTVTHTWIYPSVSFTAVPPYSQQIFSLPMQLQPGENYNIGLTYIPVNINPGGPTPGPQPVPFSCYIPFTTITTGTMENSDITLVITCGNAL